jgi:hypothetical protein
MADKVPEGIYARIRLVDLTIAEASEQVEDASFWTDTRPLILYHYPQVTLDGYWDLKVGDHQELYDFLKARGLDGVS